MKIYSNTFDLVRPDNKRIWVGPNSDFKIGVKVLSDGEETTGTIALYDGENEIQAEEDKVDGFTVFPMKSTSPSERKFRVEYNSKTNFYINLTTTKSTVFEVSEEGGEEPVIEEYVKSVSVQELAREGQLIGKVVVQDQDGVASEYQLKVPSSEPEEYVKSVSVSGLKESGDTVAKISVTDKDGEETEYEVKVDSSSSDSVYVYEDGYILKEFTEAPTAQLTLDDILIELGVTRNGTCIIPDGITFKNYSPDTFEIAFRDPNGEDGFRMARIKALGGEWFSGKNVRITITDGDGAYMAIPDFKADEVEVVHSVSMDGLKTTGSTLGFLHVDDQDYEIKSGDIQIQDLVLGTESNPGELKVYDEFHTRWTGLKIIENGPYPYPSLGCPHAFQAPTLATNRLQMGNAGLGYEQDQEGNDVFSQFNTVLVDASKSGQDSRFNTVKIMDVNDLDNEYVQMDMYNGVMTIDVHSEMDGSVELIVSDPSKIRFNVNGDAYVGQISNNQLIFVLEE